MRSSLAALALLVACDRPQPLVICHNGNCAGDADPDRDDTLDALAASLAVRWEGRPVIDGVELDTMWHRPTGTCLFEHGPGTTLPPDTALDATALVEAHLRAGGDVAWNGDRFHVFIELKPYVAERADVHTAEERVRHADCALDIFDRLTTASAGVHRLSFVFNSVEPALLTTLTERPRWPGQRDGDTAVHLGGEPAVLLDPILTGAGPSRYPLPLDLFFYAVDVPSDAQLASLSTLGLELAYWHYAFTPALTSAIQRDAPSYVLTGEAALLRRWLVD